MGQRSITYFDSVAREYQAGYAEASALGHTLRMRRARVLELLDGINGSVLDVGCGPGLMASEMLPRGCTFWGVDGSPQMIRLCETAFEGVPGAHFQVGDARALPFAEGSFDAALCMGVMDRVSHPEQAMAEIGRVLRPGGIALISFPNRLSPYAFWRSHVYYRSLGPLKRLVSALGVRRPFRLAEPARLWTPPGARRALEERIGAVQAVAYYNFGPLLSPLEELLPAVALRLAERLERLRESPVRSLGAGFVVKAVKRG